VVIYKLTINQSVMKR